MNYRRAVSGGVLLGDLHMQNSELDPVQKGSDAKQPEQSGKKIAWAILGFIVGFMLLVYGIKLLFF
jgi:hypothetical protein